MTTFLYGPQGCGKSRYKQQIADALGISKIIDDWLPGYPIHPGAMHITSDKTDLIQKNTKHLSDVRIISFDSAMKLLEDQG